MADNFESQLKSIVHSSFIASSLSLGFQLGLFDVLADFDCPASIAEIAAKSKCKARYVEEWLKMMVCAKILEVDESETKFFLPIERRHLLLSKTSPYAMFLNVTPQMYYPHTSLVACFKEDGPSGIHFKETSQFLSQIRKMGGDYWPIIENSLSKYSKDVSDLNMDVGGIKFCDVGCLEGDFVLYLAQKYPLCQFTGIDLQETVIETARHKAQQQNVTNVEFLVGNINIPLENLQQKFDYVFICHTLHDLPQPVLAAKNMYDMIKPGGKLLVVEPNFGDTIKENSAIEVTPILYAISLYYCLSTGMYDPNSRCFGIVAGRSNLTRIIEGGGFANVNFFSIFENVALSDALIVADKTIK